MLIIPCDCHVILLSDNLGCGHCKALIPTYEDVATTFKNDENVSH